MGAILNFNEYSNRHSDTIDLTSLKSHTRRLRAGLINDATEQTSCEIVAEHTAEPIKNIDDIMRISEYLIDQKRFRDNMLFIVGINFGLRVSDLRLLRFSHIINDNFTFKDTFPVFEVKTRNTRLKKHNRYITINNAVMDAVELYLENTPNVSLSDYMFRGNAHRNTTNTPMHRNSVDRILKGIASDLGLNIQMSTHTLRKTFGYHQMVMSNNDPRKLLLLSKILGHSSVAITLSYIGITNDEIAEAYRQLNLGSKKYNYLDSTFGESRVPIVG